MGCASIPEAIAGIPNPEGKAIDPLEMDGNII